MHILAKEVIAETKKLWLTTNDGGREVVFDRVDLEQQVGPFRIDVIGTKNGKRCLIEIAVTHRCSFEKAEYFKENRMAAVEIEIESRREFKCTDEFSEYVILKAPRWWISNPVLEKKSSNSEASTSQATGFLEQLRRAAGPRVGKLHYGELVEMDLKSKGVPFQNALCIKSQDLPSEYGNLALVMWGYRPLREAVGRRVGFLILFDEESSAVGAQEVLFPHADVRWVDGMSRKLLPEDLFISGRERNLYVWI